MSSCACSVVIPVYNARQHLGECLASVMEQESDFTFEVVAVDDGSTDGSAELIRESFPSVRVFQKENGGPGSARNRAASEAQSDILVFIDADDVMLPGRLQHQVAYMLAHPEVGLTFGNQRNESRPEWDANRHKRVCEGQESYVVLDNAYERLLAENSFIQNTATAVRREAYLETGGQPEHAFVGEDFAMYCNIARRYPISATNRFLTWYRQSGSGNIMASKHTYEGPPHILKSHLDQSEDLLSDDAVERAIARLRRMVNMLAGYRWTVDGRKGVMQTCREYKRYLPSGMLFKWQLLSLVPSAVPSWLRRIRHRGANPRR